MSFRRKVVLLVAVIVILGIVLGIVLITAGKGKPAASRGNTADVTFHSTSAVTPAATQQQASTQAASATVDRAQIQQQLEAGLAAQGLTSAINITQITVPTPGWLVVSLAFTDTPGDPIQAIFQASGTTQKLLLGPYTTFSTSKLDALGVPDSVRQMVKYESGGDE